MSAHVAAAFRGGYYQLRQLRPLKRCMTDEAIKTPTHAFISSRLDYCNALYCGIAGGHLDRLYNQSRTPLLVSLQIYDGGNTTPVLRQLHWLLI